jgi:FkbM family methyltransferase
MSVVETRIGEMVAIARSIVTYHGDEAQKRRMDALYGRFVKPGDLAIDVGSHVGDRVASFRRLGARVIAFEPQPGPADVIERIFQGDRMVSLQRAAVGDRPGSLKLKVNSRNPTVSTASTEFVAAADGAAGWEGQVWDREIEVPVVTLDAVLARAGLPAFVKIDVEGFEDRVLAGLARPVPALSFEFTTIQRDVAGRCLDRLQALGYARFDVSLGESQAPVFGGAGVDVETMRAHLDALPHEANSGDVYALLSG